MTIQRYEEDLWNLLAMFRGLGDMVLFLLLIVWARLLLSVFEGALNFSGEPSHRFVHPLPVSSAPNEGGLCCCSAPADLLPQVSSEREEIDSGSDMQLCIDEDLNHPPLGIACRCRSAIDV